MVTMHACDDKTNFAVKTHFFRGLCFFTNFQCEIRSFRTEISLKF